MASHESAIVVIDDSENDDGPDSPTSNTSPEVLSFEQQEAIHLFSSITDISDTKAVKDSLEMFDYDVERTINKWIEQQHSYQRSPIADNSAAFRLINRSASRINSPVKRNLFTGMPKKLDLDTKVSVQKSAIKSIPSSSSSKVLSLSWHDCVERVLQSKEPFFIDADFPPTSKSLDGRQRRASENKGQRTLCACGVPAAAKVVQSDGPNYGRFYLSCGKQTQRRAPVLVVRKQDDAQNSADCQDEAKLLKDPPVTVNNPYAKSKPSTPSKHCRTNPSSPKSPPQRRSCTFFKWDPDGSIGASGYATRYSLFVWQHFGLENNCCLYRTSIDPSQVRQGAVGNCWFLSALAVVAEKSYLVRQLLPHDKLNPQGCYEVNLCLDGAWTPVRVDSTLPVVLQDVNKTTGGSLLQSLRHGVPLNSCKELVATPAFCSAPDLQLWPALVEKAYAKAHGSYAQLSGGFIAEGLTDLTGAPTETIIFSDLIDLDELWARLLSFHQAGFLVGVATSRGGEGLVGGHAYSLLDVIEINNSLIGEQKKVTDYFSSPSKKHRKLTGSNYDTCAPIRLVRIRNP
jgi:calpain-15